MELLRCDIKAFGGIFDFFFYDKSLGKRYLVAGFIEKSMGKYINKGYR